MCLFLQTFTIIVSLSINCSLLQFHYFLFKQIQFNNFDMFVVTRIHFVAIFFCLFCCLHRSSLLFPFSHILLTFMVFVTLAHFLTHTHAVVEKLDITYYIFYVFKLSIKQLSFLVVCNFLLEILIHLVYGSH